MTTFREHEIEWTREKVARFWQFVVRHTSDDKYFSNAVGLDVILEARQRGVALHGRVLDYGCGPGHLLAHLVRFAKHCEGADFDEVALGETTRRLAGASSFQGVSLISKLPSQLAENAYDTVFLIETIEHLIGNDLPDTLGELRRILKPGGSIVVTTPNEENLDTSKRVCPECGCVFHTIQHVSSWTRGSLTSLLQHSGFEVIDCEAVTFRRFRALRHLSAVADLVRRRPPQTLMLVARKPLHT